MQAAALPLGLGGLSRAADGAELLASPSYGREYPGMLLSYLSGRLNELDARWDEERARLTTAPALEARNRFVRKTTIEMLGGLPEKTPLHPLTTGRFERDRYRVENVMFESRPNYWVTGNLYLPTRGEGPFPAIVSPCGHYPLARMEPEYQFAYMNLASAGFVVLAFDPIGQGERRHYWDPRTGETEVGGPVYEHSMPGQLLLLLGENLTQYRVWDGMRAIDYLLTRSEVDAQRIGCAGHSGGGTLTLFLSAIDARVKCAVVNQGGTFHRWPRRFGPGSRVGPSDVEQNLFPAALHGVDLPDLHAAIAPRPLLSLIEHYSPRFNAAAKEILKAYTVAGVPGHFATEEAGDPHAWTVKLRLATTRWFSRWFYQQEGPAREPDFEPEPPERLYCTPNGSLRHSRRGDTIFSIILGKQAKTPPGGPRPGNEAPRSAAALEEHRREIAGKLRSLLRFSVDSSYPLGVRHRMTTRRKGYRIEKQEFLSEPGIYVPVWVFVPERGSAPYPATVFVGGRGNHAAGGEFGLLEKLARQGHLVASLDLRGIGETEPPQSRASNRASEFHHLFSTETAMSYMAWFMDDSLLGMRLRDLLRGVDYVLRRDDAEKSGVRVIGRGMGATWALFSAVLDDRVRGVLADGGLLSYRALAMSDRYLHGANIFIPGVLKHFDLPHVAAAVADRNLTILDPVDAMRKPVGIAGARRAYEWTRQAYSVLGAGERFEVMARQPGADPADACLQFLGRWLGRSG